MTVPIVIWLSTGPAVTRPIEVQMADTLRIDRSYISDMENGKLNVACTRSR